MGWQFFKLVKMKTANTTRQMIHAAGRQFASTFKKQGHVLLRDADKAFSEADRFDQKLDKIMNIWRFRANRVFTPNVVNHMHGMLALILHILQILIILELIYSTHGHVGKMDNIHQILLPTYFHIVLRLFLQMAVLIFVIIRAFHIEQGHVMLIHFNELGRFRPVIEQLIPIFSYSLMLCTALAVGYCHINPSTGAGLGLCNTFNLTTIKSLIGVYATIQVCHHFIAIYHSYKHASLPQKKQNSSVDLGSGNTLTFDRTYATRYTDNPNLMDSVGKLDEDLTTAWKWWEYRMNKIFGAAICHHICKIFDVIMEAVTLSLIVSAAHQSHGNLQNLESMGPIFIPLYVKFFGKALVQLLACIYYYQQVCNNNQQIFEILDEPNKWVKPLEHALPVLTYTVMGITALSIGYCHLDTTNQSFALCKTFSHNVVKAVVIVIGICQLIHHLIAMSRHHVYTAKPRRKMTRYEDIPMSETTSHFGQIE